MNGGICVCVLLAALSTSCLGHPSSNAQDESRAAPSQVDTVLSEHRRQARSTPLTDQQKPTEDEGVDSRTSLTELLARLISRKGNIRRNSVNSRASGLSGLSANHRIKDRDYLGWMDFGRRSAEEYEYSS